MEAPMRPVLFRSMAGSAACMLALAGPAFAQNAGAEAVGTVLGLLITVAIGAVVGWVASLIVKGAGSGLLVDVVVGIAGAFLAGWLLPVIGVPIPAGFVGAFIAAVIGAVVLLLLIKLIRRA
jgi:uncharacterized membrane protein YeaQ/YmgE (transglycosylase-associated protein family)